MFHAGEEHKDLCKKLVYRYQVEYTVSSLVLNVMRVAASILRRQKVACKVLFSGCIGKDKFDMMNKKAQEDGVETNHCICESDPTGSHLCSKRCPNKWIPPSSSTTSAYLYPVGSSVTSWRQTGSIKS